MGIRGYIQTTQAEHDGACLSNWISHAAYRYLTNDAGLTIWTDENGDDADHWEIEIEDFDRIKTVSKDLHAHPDALDKYLEGDPELVGKGEAEQVARWLDEGIEAAEKKGYWSIQVDWF